MPQYLNLKMWFLMSSYFYSNQIALLIYKQLLDISCLALKPKKLRLLLCHLQVRPLKIKSFLESLLRL